MKPHAIGRRSLVLSGLLSLCSIAALLWLMNNTEPPPLAPTVVLLTVLVSLIVVPSAYVAIKRLADDTKAVTAVRRIGLAAAGLMVVGLAFVVGMEVGRQPADTPRPPASASQAPGSDEAVEKPDSGPGAKASPPPEVASDESSSEVATSVAMMAIVVSGALAFVGLVVGPWIFLVVRATARALARERAARARAEERAKVAAHLHDSVLQTLVLMQKRTDDPAEMARLARHTERDLRGWLYGGDGRGPVRGGEDSLAAALAREMAAVEDRFDIAVDVVTAGDCALDERTRAVVGAAREAATNAARHAGVRQVSVFADVADGEVLVRVRDRGRGFDATAGARPDRHGIRESIVGRVRRHGGTAAIQSGDGEGTEVELRMPVGDAP